MILNKQVTFQWWGGSTDLNAQYQNKKTQSDQQFQPLPKPCIRIASHRDLKVSIQAVWTPYPPALPLSIYQSAVEQTEGKKQVLGWSTHCTSAVLRLQCRHPCERDKPWGIPAEAATCVAHGKPGKRRRGKHITQHCLCLAPRSHRQCLPEMSLVSGLASRNFAPFSSARQMPAGIITLPGECQLHSIRVLAGHPTLQGLLCSQTTMASLHGTRPGG